MSNIPLVIVHKNCYDGFGAAWVAHNFFKQYEQGCDIHHALYGTEPPDVTGRDVLLFDFSYKRPVLEEMIKVAQTLTIVDHHKTSEQDLAGLDCAIFDQSKSGARLAWEYFHSDSIPAPKLIQYIEDRDLWKFILPCSKEINAYITSYERTIENFDMLHKMLETPEGFDRAITIGQSLLRQHLKNCQSVSKEARKVTLSERFGKFAGQEVVTCTCNYHMSSDVGNILAEKFTLPVITWMRRSDLVFQYSLRAKAGQGFDVAAIAKEMGGGGHTLAAGFESKELLL